VDGLVVNEAQINRNLNMTHGLLFSGRALLALVERGMSREDAYAMVQENAMRCWDSVQAGDAEPLRGLLERDPRMSGLDVEGGFLADLFGIDFFLKYVDDIFKRFPIFEKGDFPPEGGR
jgi:adenylosuccinate lyase